MPYLDKTLGEHFPNIGLPIFQIILDNLHP